MPLTPKWIILLTILIIIVFLVKENIYDLIFDLLETSSISGITKNENVQSACPIILSEGEDIYLPHIKVDEQDRIVVIGLALFSDDKLTGSLDPISSTMLLLLANKAPKRTKINLKVNNDESRKEKEFINFLLEI